MKRESALRSRLVRVAQTVQFALLLREAYCRSCANWTVCATLTRPLVT